MQSAVRPLIIALALFFPAACAGGGEPGASPREGALRAEEATADPSRSAAWEGLSAEARANVEQAALPFLLFPEEYAAATVAMSGEHFAALSARGEGITLSLHGTDVSHRVLSDEELAQALPPSHSVRGVPARILVNEAIRSAAWAELGLEWALEVECADPEGDTRCTEDEFILDLAERMVVAPRGAR